MSTLERINIVTIADLPAYASVLTRKHFEDAIAAGRSTAATISPPGVLLVYTPPAPPAPPAPPGPTPQPVDVPLVTADEVTADVERTIANVSALAASPTFRANQATSRAVMGTSEEPTELTVRLRAALATLV